MDTNNLQLVSLEDKEENAGSAFNFKHFLQRCLKNWYWIALSVFVCVFLAAAYVLRTRPTYVRSASVLIKEAAARRMATSDIESVLSFSGGSMSSKVVNEVIAFKSPAIMQEAVKRLNLTTDYYSKGIFRNNVIYGAQVPVEVEFYDVPSNISLSFNLSKDVDGQIRIAKFIYRIKKDKFEIPSTVVALGDTLRTEIGSIVVKPRDYFIGEWKKPVIVNLYSIEGATAKYSSAFKAEPVDVKNHSDVLSISIADNSVQRADDIINTVINIYNENWVEDKNKMAISTSEFINSRLASLETELKDVDDDISEFKSRNLVSDMNSVSNLYIYQLQEVGKMDQELNNQLAIFKFLKTFLRDNPGTETLIPLAASIGTSIVSTQIAEYNKSMLIRNNIRSNSSANSPVVLDMTAMLESTRAAIEATVENQINTISEQLSNLHNFEVSSNARMAQSPSKAKYLISVGRQQKVKEALYLYLLQKREENELSQAFTAYNTRVITPPMGIARPTSPKKMQLLAIALLMGLFLPIFVIYIIELTDTKIRSKQDLDGLSLPTLGEIPFEAPKKKVSGLIGRKSQPVPSVIVKPGVRSVINEAFRVFRTNLEFMERGVQCPVISLTSFNPGSGKTFISMNSAAALAIKGKKVLVIDCDLRRSSLSEYVALPKKGLTDYLSGEIESVDSIIAPVAGFKSLWVLPVGSVPPNPSELLSQDVFSAMIEQLKTKFDAIIIDCPPVDIVADTQIINECVDRTIFVVRAGVLDRKDVVNLQKAYDTKRFKNLCYVFNGVERASSYYGHYGAYGTYGS